jgi:pyruvate kinase
VDHVCSTKIIATVGPASSSPEVLSELIANGVDVFRFNMGHGTHDDHRATMTNLRQAAEGSGRAVALMCDLGGPKLRIGPMPEAGVELVDETTIDLVCGGDSFEGDAQRFWTRHAVLAQDVEVGEPVLLDDGRLILEAAGITGQTIHCKVLAGGRLTSRKGINLPDTELSLPSLTEKDHKDLEFALAQGVDFVALSFVRTRGEIDALRRHIGSGPNDPGIIAKIEKPQAIDNLEAIVSASNGVMVARGDLGVEYPVEQVPMLQKKIIHEANRQGRISIVATEMLQSMVSSPRPTRAEAGDVANAVLDGADCVMLSQETSIGDHPAKVAQTMRQICREVEQSEDYQDGARRTMLKVDARKSLQNAAARAAIGMAHDLDVAAVASFTATGTTARLTTDYRCRVPVFGFTSNPITYRRMAIYAGVRPCLIEEGRTVEGTIARMLDEVVGQGGASPGELVVVTTKSRPEFRGGTDTIRLIRVAG